MNNIFYFFRGFWKQYGVAIKKDFKKIIHIWLMLWVFIAWCFLGYHFIGNSINYLIEQRAHYSEVSKSLLSLIYLVFFSSGYVSASILIARFEKVIRELFGTSTEIKALLINGYQQSVKASKSWFISTTNKGKTNDK
jgi:hypothetical protein